MKDIRHKQGDVIAMKLQDIIKCNVNKRPRNLLIKFS